MIKAPVRKRISDADTVTGQDVTVLARDLQDAILSFVDSGKYSYRGFASFPIRLAVPTQPWAILCARIQPSNSAQASAPQGGFCSFAYDAARGAASVTSINALDSVTAAALPADVIYDFSFWVVF